MTATIIIVGVATFGLISLFKTPYIPVADFDECVARGYPVMESYPRRCTAPDGATFSEDIGNAPEKTDLIYLNFPGPNQTLTSSSVTISGEARGYWFFEASFPVEIVDTDNNVLGRGIAEATTDWMTEEFVPFNAVIKISKDYNGPASIILHKDNPSGLPENDDRLIVPVDIFISDEDMSIKVYFGKSSSDGNIIDCSEVYPVERTVARTYGTAKAALEELFKGPSDEEKAEGFFTSINEGVKINLISIVDGTATVDLSEELEFQVGGSCRVTAIRAEIVETLKQFPSVTGVIISINGRTEDILQP